MSAARGQERRQIRRERKDGRAVSNKQRRKGLEVDSKLVFIALCTEDILIAKESCCWAPSLET